jgi:hypothetical protein
VGFGAYYSNPAATQLLLASDGRERRPDPFNGHIDEFRISHIQRSDGWIATTWNNMSDPGAFAIAEDEEQEAASWPAPVWSSA